MRLLTENFSEVTAAILAGGLGMRFRQVLDDRPKVLAEVQGRPFLQYLLDQLMPWGIGRVVLCTGYLGDQIESHFGDSYGSLRLIYSRERSALGTAGALRLALPHFRSDSILVLNGDSYCKADLRSFWSWHSQHGSVATLLLVKNPYTKRYGRVQIDERGHILTFKEKQNAEGSGWINAGIYLFGHPFLQSIPGSGPVSLEQDVLPLWVGKGLKGFETDGEFIDIGTPESYRSAEKFFAGDISK